MTEPVALLFASDLHFGTHAIDQAEMAQAFGSTIFPLVAETDLFFINGDFFDTLVSFDSHAFDPIYDVILSLFTLCERHQTTLRIMQGTHSHDRSQLRRFVGFYQKGGYTFNFKVIEQIDVEEIAVKDRSLRVLYVPDDLPVRTTAAAMELIHTRLQTQGWERVDYACMHGFFDFTFPKMLDESQRVVFKEAAFDFVTKMIDVGHVHQHRTSGKVISNGSFDRLVFGDEDPKGCVRVFDYPDHYTAQFVPNVNPALFDTITLEAELETQDWEKRLREHLTRRVSSRRRYLRVVLENTDHRDAVRQWMKTEYPEVGFKVEKRKGTDDEGAVMVPSSELFTTLERRQAPTPLTIGSHIHAHILETNLLDDGALSVEEIEAYLVAPA